MGIKDSLEAITKLFESKKVIDLAVIQSALGGVSAMTVFRYLQKIPYRRSYNYNGRYYTKHEPSQYDRYGLWSHGDIHFSQDGSLVKTVKRLVYEAEAGATHQELNEILRVRVHNTLYGLFSKCEIKREKILYFYIYLHNDPAKREIQIKNRNQQIISQKAAAAEGKISERIVIQILLILIHHPGAKAADIVRYLYGQSPPISMKQVNEVFIRYELDKIGEKRGS
jgi:hypothetical protein